jgi:uncharacterized protein
LPASIARVDTPKGGAYLRQFCKHFAHKAGDELSVEFGDSSGQLVYLSPEFGPEILTLEAAAEEGPLLLRATCDVEGGLHDLESWTGDHLERFGRRDGLRVAWVAADD